MIYNKTKPTSHPLLLFVLLRNEVLDLININCPHTNDNFSHFAWPNILGEDEEMFPVPGRPWHKKHSIPRAALAVYTCTYPKDLAIYLLSK